MLGTIASQRGLIIILTLALALRTIFALIFIGEIDTEGAEYARIAENIRFGNGYSGIATKGVQLFFPPLFPLLIASLSALTGDVELAGRSVNVLFGALLVIPVFGIATRLYGRTMGLFAAALVAVHPYLVYFSTTVYCENVYLTLLLSTVLATMITADRPLLRNLLLVGALYGLTYLVRPEAVAFLCVAAICFWLQCLLAQRDGHGLFSKSARRIAIIFASFCFVAGPYVLWLSLQTGQLRFQAKTPLNVATELRIQQGAPSYAASFAVGADLAATGTYNRPNINVINSERVSTGEIAWIAARKFEAVLKYAITIIASELEFGSPALLLLAVLGLFCKPWRPRMAVDQIHLISLLGISALAPIFIYYLSPRFYLLFPVIFCIWAAAGLQALAKWAHLTAAGFGRFERTQRWAGRFAVTIAFISVVAPAALATRDDLLSMRGSRPIKALSIDLADTEGKLKIADVSTPFAFHAMADFIWLPYSDAKTARRYLAQEQATHVVLRGNDLEATPYARDWFENGVPDARLVAEAQHTHNSTGLVKLYKLELAPATSLAK